MSEKQFKTKYYLKSRQGIILGVVKVNEEDNVLSWGKIVDLLNSLTEENEVLLENLLKRQEDFRKSEKEYHERIMNYQKEIKGLENIIFNLKNEIYNLKNDKGYYTDKRRFDLYD